MFDFCKIMQEKARIESMDSLRLINCLHHDVLESPAPETTARAFI